MNKEFIPYEEALALKELGFDEECFGYYDVTGEISTEEILFQGEVVSIKAPLYQQAFRWFREKYGLFGKVDRDMEKVSGKLVYTEYFSYFITYEIDEYPLALGFDIENTTHEQAELACLRKLIEIVKENKDE